MLYHPIEVTGAPKQRLLPAITDPFVLPQENAVVVRLGHKRSEEKKNHHPMDTYLYLEAAKKILSAYNE